jgi:hypothetical protein
MRLLGNAGRRCRTSLRYAQGSRPLSLADWIKLLTCEPHVPKDGCLGEIPNTVNVMSGFDVRIRSCDGG